MPKVSQISQFSERPFSDRERLPITWTGGFTSHHHHDRTVISYAQLSSLDELIARIVQLKQAGRTLKQIANRLNQEGIRSLRGCLFTNDTISRLLVDRGLHFPPERKRPDSVPLADGEWWLPDLADKLQMPRTTLNHWYSIGWVRGRKLPGVRGRLILWADAEDVARLRRLRQAHRRWSDCPHPKELTTPKSASTGC